MLRPSLEGRVIATGFNCFVKIEKTEGGGFEKIGFATSFNATEDFQVQEATVLGNLGPVSIDPQGYTCSITLDGFLPAKGKVAGDAGSQYSNIAEVAITDFIPKREDFMTDNDFGKTKIHGLQLWNETETVALFEAEGVIITNAGISVEGNSYARNNVQMRAIERVYKN